MRTGPFSAFAVTLLLVSTLAAWAAGPDNDDFERRISLAGAEAEFVYYPLDATREAGEPDHWDAPLVGEASAWWTWIAPVDGGLRLLGLSDFGPAHQINVYTGGTLGTLREEWRISVGDRYPVYFPVKAGVAYHIALSVRSGHQTWPNASPRTYRLHFLAPPANDAFASRIKVSGPRVVLAGHNVGATRETNEPWHAEDAALPASVWWEWTPTVSGPIMANWTRGAGTLAIYRGGELALLSPLASPIATAGEPLQLAVAAFDRLVAPFTVDLRVSELRVTAPAHGTVFDEAGDVAVRLVGVSEEIVEVMVRFGNRFQTHYGNPTSLVLTNVSPGRHQIDVHAVHADGSVIAAPSVSILVRPGGPTPAIAREVGASDRLLGGEFFSDTGATNVWWRWTAPSAGKIVLDRAGNGATGDLFRQAFVGPVDGLAAVPWDGDAHPGADRVTLQAAAGVTYWFQLWPSSGTRGWGATQFRFVPAAPNDAFANAEVLSGSGFERLLPAEWTTCEPGEPDACEPGTGTQWFAWTAPRAGRLSVSVENWWGAAPVASFSIFTGATIGSLDRFAGPAYDGAVTAEPGRTYFVQVRVPEDLEDRPQPTLRLAFGAFPANDNVADAVPLPVLEGTISGSNDFATREANESPMLTGERSVWYRFTAPEGGILGVRVRGAGPSADRHHPQVWFLKGDSAATLEWFERQHRVATMPAAELEAGGTVLVVVSGSGSWIPDERTEFALEHVFHTRPANDALAARQRLEGPSASTQATFFAATWEAGEPPGAHGGARRSVWWEWTAPHGGTLQILSGAGEAGLFTGASVDSLSAVPAITPKVFDASLYSVAAGQRYLVRVAGTGFPDDPFRAEARGEFPLSLELNTLTIRTPTNGTVAHPDTPLELAVDHAGAAGLDQVWFFRANRSDAPLLLASAVAPSWSTTISGLPPGRHLLQAVATNRDGRAMLSPPVPLRVPPINDAFAAATELAGRQVTVTGRWTGASLEVGEPRLTPQISGSVWFRWTAPADGSLRISSSTGGMREVFTGAELSRLTWVPPSGANHPVRAGEVYSIRLNSSSQVPGDVQANWLRLGLESVVLASPLAGSRLEFGSPVAIRITTSERTNTISSIELMGDGAPLASLTAPPFELTWESLPPGDHRLEARVRFSDGEELALTPVSFTVKPANEQFSRAKALPGPTGEEAGTTYGIVPQGSGFRSVWYSWTAPADGLLAAAATASFHAPTQLTLYTGADPAALTEVPNRADNGHGAWFVSSNTTYHLAVATSGHDFTLRWGFDPPAINDAFTARLPLVGTAGELQASLVLATTEPGEPIHSQTVPAVATVWWTYTPPEDGILSMRFPDDRPAPDSLRAYVGDELSSLVPLKPAGAMPHSPASFPRDYAVAAGVPVQIVLAWPRDDVPEQPWQWRWRPRLANDHFAARLPLAGRQVEVSGSTLGARREAGEPELFLNPEPTVWWSWTAPADGDLVVTVEGTSYSHYVAVHQGSMLDRLELLGGYTPATQLIVPVRAGVPYAVTVYAGEPPGGDYRLTLDLRSRPANDDFAQRRWLEGNRIGFVAENWRATREYGEPLHAGLHGGRSVWFAWRAPADGEVELTLNSATYMMLAVYLGTEVAGLREVASALAEGGPATLRFSVRSGDDYVLAVDGRNGDFGILAGSLEPVTSSTGRHAMGLAFVPALPPALQVEVLAGSPAVLRVAGVAAGWLLETTVDWEAWTEVVPAGGAGTGSLDIEISPAEPARFFRLRRSGQH